MTTTNATITALLSFLASFGAGHAAPGEARQAAPPAAAAVKVIHVDDGDTITALTDDFRQFKVRLANIDAPETSHGRCRPGQPHSEKAGGRLAQLVKGQRVLLRCVDTDVFKRSVCDVILGDTTASRILVKEGYAWANRGGKGYVRDREVYALEDQARAAHAGLWQDKSPTAPWVWRRTEWMQPAQGCGVRKGGA